MTLAFYQQLAESLHQGAVVVATVIHTIGSVPREVGAKMLLDASGRIIQTIGGGAGEAKVIRHARTVLATGKKQQVEIDLSGAAQRQTEGICGGHMQVWLERWQGEPALTLTQTILARLQAGQSVTLVTPFAQSQLPYLLDAGTPQAEGFWEPLTPPPCLLIVGAGHCGMQLAKVADLIGFQVIVQDDRPEWANRQHYPQASQIYTRPIAAVVAGLADHTQLYAALVTRGYDVDLDALAALLAKPVPCRYIGMIGSQPRVRRVLQTLEQQGWSRHVLKTLYAPIGLDIGALTPAEIAVSIGAELIMVQRGGTGQPLTATDFL
jgi:xanthine dehydrogenase accessory factor